MVHSQKYARVECERRFLLAECPPDLERAEYDRIEDLYITGARLRLRRITASNGTEVRYKLNQKIDDAAERRLVTSMYLTPGEYARLSQLPGKRLVKRRYHRLWDGIEFAVDVFDGALTGLVLTEVEAAADAELHALAPPPVAHVEVTHRVEFTGAQLARAPSPIPLELARSLWPARPISRPQPAQWVVIRTLDTADPPALARAFSAMHKEESQYQRYLIEQASGERVVLVAWNGASVAGYVTIVWAPSYPPFRTGGIAEIQDLNVVASQRRRGIATTLLDEAEALIAQRSAIAGIGVGLHSGYNAAQRLYVLRGYIPDGHGVAHGMHFVQDREQWPFDDDLVLHLTKTL